MVAIGADNVLVVLGGVHFVRLNGWMVVGVMMVVVWIGVGVLGMADVVLVVVVLLVMGLGRRRQRRRGPVIWIMGMDGRMWRVRGRLLVGVGAADVRAAGGRGRAAGA